MPCTPSAYSVAQTILDGEGDYVMVVKDNQPQIRADIQLLLQESQVVAETLTATETVDLGHGRIEVRRLTASSALAGYLDWPGLQQVFKIVRTTTCKRTGQERCQSVYGITNLPPRLPPMRPANSAWPVSTGASKTKRIGCGM